MKINLKSLKYYFLSCNNPKRVAHMNKEFSEYDITEVNPVPMNIGISKTQSGATGFCRMLDLAIRNQDKTKSFQPFVLLEDDIKKYRDFPSELDIPDNSDILYIGLSSWGMTNAKRGSNGTVCMSNVKNSPEVMKVYNMLSTHGFIVCSLTGLLTLQKCLLEDFYRNRGYDMTLAHIQPHINAYALKIPLVFQYYALGGKEIDTKFQIVLQEDKYIPKEWINNTNISYKTIYQ